MGVVVGYTTSFIVNGNPATNASWNMNANAQYFWVMDGNVQPVESLTILKPTTTVNATVYAPSSSINVSPSSACDSLSAVAIVGVNASPAGCDGGGDADIPSQMIPTSYSYSKNDGIMPGEESWGLMMYVGDNLPTYVIRGLAQGSATTGAGITFAGDTTDGSSGNVSAQGIGRSDTMKAGQVSAVGGGSSTTGDTGNGSANIPYTPLYV